MNIKTIFCAQDRDSIRQILIKISEKVDLSVIDYCTYKNQINYIKLFDNTEGGFYIAFITENATKDSAYIEIIRRIWKESADNDDVDILFIVINNASVPNFIKSNLIIPFNIQNMDIQDNEDEYNILCENLMHYINKTSDAKEIVKISSGQKQKKMNYALFFSLPFFLVLSVVIISFLDYSFKNEHNILNAFFPFLLIFLVFLGFAWGIVSNQNQNIHTDNTNTYSRFLKNELTKLNSKKSYTSEISPKESSQMDALTLMRVNLASIREYYEWSQVQAKRSFVLSVMMCITGLILFSISIIVALFFNSGFEVSFLPAIGGVIVELIAGTALFVYRSSIKQLNYYHKALHEDERFLSSVNLINKFSSEDKADSMLEEIIRSEIQMNIIGATERNQKDKIKVKMTKNKS